jgi:hypothetical protein
MVKTTPLKRMRAALQKIADLPLIQRPGLPDTRARARRIAVGALKSFKAKR